MKYLAHVPTEQYGFISVELEGTAEETVAAYKELTEAFKGGSGLPTKEWCVFLDCYVETGKPPEGGLDDWAQMSDQQKFIINEIKKCFKRINKD